MRKKFVTWYVEEIKKQMGAGVPAESIDVNLKLTPLKALHASWLIELYNVLTTADGREMVLHVFFKVNNSFNKNPLNLPHLPKKKRNFKKIFSDLLKSSKDCISSINVYLPSIFLIPCCVSQNKNPNNVYIQELCTKDVFKT